jgi:PST family polysaccharide transporter
MASQSKLFSNFFFLGLVQAINSLLQLLVIPYLISIIGTDGLGVVSVAQVVMFYLSVFTDYGFNQTATRDVAVSRSDQAAISGIFFRVFFSRVILCGIAFLVLLLLVLTVPVFREHMWVYFGGFAFVVGQTSLVNWFFQGLEKMHIVAFTTLLARLIFVALVFAFIRHKQDDFLYLLFLGVGNLLGGVVSMILAFRVCHIRFTRPSRSAIRRELKDGWHLALTNLSSNTCQYANIFILRLFTNDFVTGYYSIAERLFFTTRQMLAVVSQSIYPRVCQLVQAGRDSVTRFFRRVYVPILCLVIAGSAGLVVLSPQVLAFFLHEDYRNAVPLLRVLAIVSVIVCLSIPPSLVILAINRTKSYFRVYTLATIVNIIANLILARSFGATGTVMAILITELCILLGLAYDVYRRYLRGSAVANDRTTS